MVVILLGLTFFIYILPVELTISFFRKEADDYLAFEVKTLFINRKLEVSYLDFREYLRPQLELTAGLKDRDINLKTDLTKEKMEKLIDWIEELNKLADLLQLISLFTDNCRLFYCKIQFGFRNPAYTGFVSGSLWGVKGILDGILGRLFKFQSQPIIKVEPEFNTVKPVEVESKSIFEFCLGNIIITGIRILLLIVKKGEIEV